MKPELASIISIPNSQIPTSQWKIYYLWLLPITFKDVEEWQLLYHNEITFYKGLVASLSRFADHILRQKTFAICRSYLRYKAFKLFWVLSCKLWLEKIDVIFNRVWRGARRFSFPNKVWHNSRKLMFLISVRTIYLGYYVTQSLSWLQKVEAQVYVGSQAINKEIVKQLFPTSITEENSGN